MKLSSVSSDPPPWGVKGLSLSEGKLSQRHLLTFGAGWGHLCDGAASSELLLSCPDQVDTLERQLRWHHRNTSTHGQGRKPGDSWRQR